ncbi:hypothetical protein N658DRAFT_284360 [Parathielavia hyrcaniae]|uniref:Uncharacterized protein n=1 Tax=Parathielavia hyrcaniae TaxID=113614 RepID=A0AAN6T3Q7_9PEZI|nr:hypothetical protein N658DRAFT_284360 [Parathielavia hyrcaniae]
MTSMKLFHFQALVLHITSKISLPLTFHILLCLQDPATSLPAECVALATSLENGMWRLRSTSVGLVNHPPRVSVHQSSCDSSASPQLHLSLSSDINLPVWTAFCILSQPGRCIARYRARLTHRYLSRASHRTVSGQTNGISDVSVAVERRGGQPKTTFISATTPSFTFINRTIAGLISCSSSYDITCFWFRHISRLSGAWRLFFNNAVTADLSLFFGLLSLTAWLVTDPMEGRHVG